MIRTQGATLGGIVLLVYATGLVGVSIMLLSYGYDGTGAVGRRGWIYLAVGLVLYAPGLYIVASTARRRKRYTQEQIGLLHAQNAPGGLLPRDQRAAVGAVPLRTSHQVIDAQYVYRVAVESEAGPASVTARSDVPSRNEAVAAVGTDQDSTVANSNTLFPLRCESDKVLLLSDAQQQTSDAIQN